MGPVVTDYASKLAQILIVKGKKYVKAAIEKDASNRYSLKKTWYLPLLDASGLPAGEYHGEVINAISDGQWVQIWLNPYESTKERNICDGATWFPDVFLGVDLRPSAAFHDPWYLEMKQMAKVFNVDEEILRLVGDRGFTSINLVENAGKRFVKTVSTMVHWGVRIGGGVYHKLHAGASAILMALVLTVLAGCAGCVSTWFEDEGDYESPAIEKVE